MRPLTVDILTYAPTAFFHCQTCEFVWQQAGMGQKAHAEQMANNLPSDLMDDYRRLSDWIIALITKHQDRLAIRVIDAASIHGVLASLRYGVRRYPAAIVAGRVKLSPLDFATAEAAIEQQLAAQTTT